VDERHIREQADRFGLTDRIVFHGQVPRQEALSAVKGANLAVVITSVEEEETLEDKGIVTGKIFEAVGLATPVLLIAPRGSDAGAITAATGLVKSFVGIEIQEMASFLQDVVGGKAPQSRNIENCSWATISKKLDALLRAVVVRDSCPILVRDGDGGRSGSSSPTQAR
jgi:glycosyltransferase involved in cell wall biosynthesis